MVCGHLCPISWVYLFILKLIPVCGFTSNYLIKYIIVYLSVHLLYAAVFLVTFSKSFLNANETMAYSN